MDGFQVDDQTNQCVAVTDTFRISIGEFIPLILGAVFGFVAVVLVVIIIINYYGNSMDCAKEKK